MYSLFASNVISSFFKNIPFEVVLCHLIVHIIATKNTLKIVVYIKKFQKFRKQLLKFIKATFWHSRSFKSICLK